MRFVAANDNIPPPAVRRRRWLMALSVAAVMGVGVVPFVL